MGYLNNLYLANGNESTLSEASRGDTLSIEPVGSFKNEKVYRVEGTKKLVTHKFNPKETTQIRYDSSGNPITFKLL